MPVACWNVRTEILKGLYNALGPEKWFEYRHSPVCMFPRNGISKPARWVKQEV